MSDLDHVRVANLLRIIHDTSELPMLRHIRDEATAALVDINNDIAKAKEPKATYDKANDPTRHDNKPKAIPTPAESSFRVK